MKREKENTAKTEFNRIYGLYGKSIFNFCLSRLSGDVECAEDCTQETFIVFYKRLAKGESFEEPRAFLYKTAVNIIMRSKTKQQKRAVNETELDDKIPFVQSETKIESDIDYESVLKRIDELLSEDEMKLFTLFFIENLKVKDISQLLNITPGACSTRLLRLRIKLKDGIKEYL